MKKIIILRPVIFVLALLSTSLLHAQSVAINTDGTVGTTTTSYAMKAKINGKDWVASSMMPPDAAGRIVGYYENGYIGLPYSKTDMVVDKK